MLLEHCAKPERKAAVNSGDQSIRISCSPLKCAQPGLIRDWLHLHLIRSAASFITHFLLRASNIMNRYNSSVGSKSSDVGSAPLMSQIKLSGKKWELLGT